MSESVRYRWELQERMRRQAYLDRIRYTTAGFYNRYQEIFSDIVHQGLEQYLPEEFENTRSLLSKLEYLLDNDPERARELSKEIAPRIGSLPSLARSAKIEFEVGKRKQQKRLLEMREKATSELEEFLQSALTEIRDPIVCDFALSDLEVIRNEYAGRRVDISELSDTKEKIRTRIADAIEKASLKAKDWKDKKARENASETKEMLIQIHKDQILSDSESSKDTINTILSNLEALQRKTLDRSLALEDIQAELSSVTEKTDESVIDENCRRMLVRSILDSLEKVGFVVETPKRQSGDDDEVIIRARKPAGSQASFRVTANGGMIYKFDNYEGMKCKEDIDKILPILQQIYGIELSEERVLWQNPDRISKSTKPIESGNKEKHHG